jgi:hypothetical protein
MAPIFLELGVAKGGALDDGRLGPQQALVLEDVEFPLRGLVDAFGEMDHERLGLGPVDLRLPDRMSRMFMRMWLAPSPSSFWFSTFRTRPLKQS